MNLILDKGHSRVAVYYEQPTNIIGLVLVKNLLTIHPEDEVPVKSVTIRRIPRVPETMPLYDILNEFQKGHSHMAVVVRQCNRTEDQSSSKSPAHNSVMDVKVDIDGEKTLNEKALKAKRSFQKMKSFPKSGNNSYRGTSRSKKWKKEMYLDILQIDGCSLLKLPEVEEAVGIITMEDVIEELLHAIAGFEVVFLMFNIGLELSVERLSSMKKYVFGLGSAQEIFAAKHLQVTYGLNHMLQFGWTRNATYMTSGKMGELFSKVEEVRN